MSELKKGFKKHMYRNESMLNAIHDDLNKKKVNPKKLLTMFSAFAVALLLFIGTNDVVEAPLVDTVYARVSVDINPSLEFTIDENHIVTGAYYFNEDAEGLDLDQFNGLKVNEAIKQVIDLANEQGYIKTDDETSDYVVVAVNIVDEDGNLSDEEEDEVAISLTDEMGEYLSANSLEALRIVYFVASDEEAEEADEKGESMGISILDNLGTHEDGTPITVKDFVLDVNNLEAMADRSVEITNQEGAMADLILRFIEDMGDSEINIESYNDEFNEVTDMVKLKTLIAKIRNETRVAEMKAAKDSEETSEETDVKNENKPTDEEKADAAEAQAQAKVDREAAKAENPDDEEVVEEEDVTE